MKKMGFKTLFVVTLGISISFCLSHVVRTSAGAPVCSPPGAGVFGRNWGCGYLTNEPRVSNDWVFVASGATQYTGLAPNWADCLTNPSVPCMTEQTFIQGIQARLFDNSPHGGGIINQGRAAAMVDIMLGKSGASFGSYASGITAGVAYAQQNFNNWKNLVDLYASGSVAGYSVDFNANIDFSTVNSNGMGMYHGVLGVGQADQPCNTTNVCTPDVDFFTGFSDPEYDRAVVFYMPGGKRFIIKDKCGNLTGDSTALEIPPTNYNLAPTVTAKVNGVPGTSAKTGDTIQFSYNVDNTGNSTSPSATCTIYRNKFTTPHAGPPPYDTGPASGTSAGTGCPRTFPANTNVGLLTDAKITVTAADQGDTFCATLAVKPASPSVGTGYAEACVTVKNVNEPYFSVQNGDVQTGNCMQTGPGSTSDYDTDGSVVSWNQEVTGSYAGAGTQYAAFALGYLQDFATAQSNPTSALTGTGLSFANNGIPGYIATSGSGQDTYGGDYGGYHACVPDFYDSQGAIQTGPYETNGGQTTTLNVTQGTHPIIRVNGDAFISGNIIYAGSGSYASVKSIPSFTLIAKGNIYISSSVRQLDGLYVAEPSGSGASVTGGTIYDCATATSPTAFTAAALNQSLYNACDTQLVVNGSFVAREVELLRTKGSAQGASPTPAETFNYTPEIWLTDPPAGGTAGTTGDDSYDAITSLPPSL